MKKILSVALVCILALGFITVNAQKLESHKGGVVVNSQNEKSSKALAELKYCTNSFEDGIGVDGAASFNAAITFPASAIGAFVGTKLTKIKIGISEPAPGLSACKVWVAKTKTGQRLVEQSFTGVAGQWNEITLTTPYDITAGELCIGYDVTVTGGFPLAVSPNTQNAANGGHIAIGGQWTTLAANKLDGNLCIIGIAEGDFPDYIDMELKSVNVPKFTKINTDIVMSGLVVNNSNINIASYDVSYKIDGGTATTINVTNANLAPGASKAFEFPAFKLNSVGTKSIQFTVTTTGDELAANNSITKEITVYEDAFKRKVVMEHFTTEKCPNCPAAEKYLTTLVGSNPDVIWISNHSGYYTDQYTVTEAYLKFFNSTEGTYAPAIMLDQAWLAPDGDPGPVFFPASTYTPALVNDRLSTPSFASVVFESFNYNPVTRELKMKLSGETKMALSGNPVMTVFVVENDLHSDQTGITRHEHVLRKVISSVWGDKITIEGNKYSKEYTFKVDDNFKITNLKIAAFLSNYDSANINNCEIYNGEQVAFMDYKPTGSIVIETASNNEKWGLTSGDSFYMPGDQVTLTTTAKAGYKFKNWALNGTAVSTDPTYMFTAPATDAKYTATFEKAYEVKVTITPKNGGKVTGAGWYLNEESVTLVATPSENYKFIAWKLSNEEVSTDPTYTFPMSKKTLTYTALFEPTNSVSDVVELAVNVYPNPAKNTIYVDGDYNTLSIFDATGKLIKTVEAQSSINVADLNNGMYILNIVGKNATKTTKIMISK